MAMNFDIITIFPDFFRSALAIGVTGKAIEAGIIKINPVNLRDFTHDRHKTTDDRPFGGGEGMVMTPAPLFEALKALKAAPPEPFVIYMTPRGRPFCQKTAVELAGKERLAIICGRYEGVDERICEHCVDMEISIGDYVLSGGELPAMVLIDAVSRLVPGVLGCNSSAEHDSFSDGLLEHPQYTRPEVFNGWRVPGVLLSGNHAEIAAWRRREALLATLRRRPDLLNAADISPEERRWLEAQEAGE
jgi:tRNA (guanine37-N1)-methyltransferase